MSIEWGKVVTYCLCSGQHGILWRKHLTSGALMCVCEAVYAEHSSMNSPKHQQSNPIQSKPIMRKLTQQLEGSIAACHEILSRATRY
jgi:hypothetical protein